MCGLAYMHIFPSSVCWEGPETTDTPVAVSTLSIQILVSKYYSPIKGTRVPYSRARAGKIPDELETSSGDRKKGSAQKTMVAFCKGKRVNLKDFPMAKVRTIWVTKWTTIILHYNPQNKINIHEPILIQINNWINE